MAVGHRKRLRKLVEDVGLENLSIYQQMEYILYFVLPRKNTTEVAHRLIDTYGNIHSVLNASASELAMIEGLGPDSSCQLSHFVQILSLYQVSKNSNKADLSTLGRAAKFMYDMLSDKKEEQLIAVALNQRSELISYKRLAVGQEDSLNFNKTELVRFISSNKAKIIILAHNHPDGTCTPSKEDNVAHTEILRFLTAVGVNLHDNLIVGSDGVFSFKNLGKLLLPLEEGKFVNYTIN